MSPADLRLTSDLFTYVLGGFSVLAAAFVVFGKNLFHALLAFTAMLISVAGLFAVLGADFLAIVQVFVYVGGVVVLLLFGIMLTASEPSAPVLIDSVHSLVGAVAALGLAALAVPALAGLGATAPAAPAPGGSASAIGGLLLSSYTLPFEVVGVVLLVAAIAAIVIVKRGEAR